MQATPFPPYLWCSFTRFGNSFMQGWQLVDHASRTTIFPLWAATSFCVSSQLTISSDTFSLDFSPDSFAAAFLSAAFSSAPIPGNWKAAERNRLLANRVTADELIIGELHSDTE